tara:strand:- start:1104 stop:1301 length:198 start_codon:yes stop_codon:yes gene_type:complete
MNIPLKLIACILMGMCLIGFSIGYIVGYYIYGQHQTYIYMYASAPLLGLGSGLIIYGTLYGRDLS